VQATALGEEETSFGNQNIRAVIDNFLLKITLTASGDIQAVCLVLFTHLEECETPPWQIIDREASIPPPDANRRIRPQPEGVAVIIFCIYLKSNQLWHPQHKSDNISPIGFSWERKF
jgi:hypothetical protein